MLLKTTNFHDVPLTYSHRLNQNNPDFGMFKTERVLKPRCYNRNSMTEMIRLFHSEVTERTNLKN